MTLLVDEAGDEAQGWRDLPPERKGLLRLRMAAACARAGIGLGKDQTPGELALRHSEKEVQRPHLLVVDQAMHRVLTGEVKRLLITLPPQTGKSQRVTEWGAFWWLTHNPLAKIIALSYAAPLAAKRGKNVRKLIREYGAEYGLELDPESKSVLDWSLTCGGGMRSAGIGGSITGMAGDLGYVDDPHKNRAEADSPEMRENVWDAYSGDLLSRMAPDAPIVVVHTRWHPKDLGGRLVEKEGRIEDGGKWLVVHMPAYADPARFGPDPVGRSQGEPLTHPRIAEGDLETLVRHWETKRDGSTTRDWHSLYQGDPIPGEGALTSLDLLERQRDYQTQVDRVTIAVAVDPSGDGDDEAGIVGGYLGSDGRCYWLADRTGIMDAGKWGRAACELAAEIDADRIIYESNYGGGMVKVVIRTAWEALGREWLEAAAKRRQEDPEYDPGPNPYAKTRCPRIVAVSAKRGKFIRAQPIAQQLVEDKVRLAAPMPEVEREWVTWQQTSSFSPGRIDASVYLTYKLLPVPGMTQVMSTPSEMGRDSTGKSRTARKRIDRGRPG